jgi:NADPH2:quinone reductase
MTIPSHMRALQLHEFAGHGSIRLRLVEKAVPTPGPCQVLVAVRASPVNQSDILFCEGRYSAPSRLPITPGFEGCGVVVQAGSWRGRWLVGRRVACGTPTGDGLWAEYAAVPLWNCLPLPRHVDDEQGACAIVNPVTAWALFEPLRRGTHRAMVQTAAASQLGRMILRLSQRYRRPVCWSPPGYESTDGGSRKYRPGTDLCVKPCHAKTSRNPHVAHRVHAVRRFATVLLQFRCSTHGSAHPLYT